MYTFQMTQVYYQEYGQIADKILKCSGWTVETIDWIYISETVTINHFGMHSEKNDFTFKWIAFGTV